MAGLPSPHTLQIYYYIDGSNDSYVYFDNCEGLIEDRFLSAIAGSYDYYLNAAYSIVASIGMNYEDYVHDTMDPSVYILQIYLKTKPISVSRGIPYIYRNNVFKRARPIIIKTTNMGKIPTNALLTNAGIPYLTNDKQFVLTTGSTNLTPESVEDFILYEFITYAARILSQ